MATEISDWDDLAEQCSKLGLVLPSGFAVLPGNLQSAKSYDELTASNLTVTLRKLWRQAGVVESTVEQPQQKWNELQQKDFSLILPTLFFAWSTWDENKELIDLVLETTSNYAKDFFKGFIGQKR